MQRIVYFHSDVDFVVATHLSHAAHALLARAEVTEHEELEGHHDDDRPDRDGEEAPRTLVEGTGGG